MEYFRALLTQEGLMAAMLVRCPQCDSDHVVKRGKTDMGKQRYLCQNDACSQRTFIVD
jgi:transposase-like protein